MDTKLKKTHKRTNLIILLCIVIPALLLVALYPQIGKAMYGIRKEHESSQESPNYEEYVLDDTFVNYAMETCYILYANRLAELGTEIDMAFFENYGWTNDYGKVRENVRFTATHDDGTESVESNGDTLGNEITVGYLTITFDSTGFMKETDLTGDVRTELNTASSLFQQANKSVTQFRNNVESYEEKNQIDMDESLYMPKDLKVTFAIDEDSIFIVDQYLVRYDTYWDDDALFETGGIFLISIAILLVVISAIVLPLIKKLETGWEKLFCLPFEIIACLGVGAGFGIFAMYFMMAYTCGSASLVYPKLQLLGYKINEQTWYILLLVLNLIAWAVLFFAIYVVVCSLRQFFCSPKQYFKKRILLVRLIQFLWKKIIQIDIHEKLPRTIVLLSLLNGILVMILCSICQITIDGEFDPYFLPRYLFIAIIWSLVFAIILYAKGTKLQEQYRHLLDATKRMGDGDLKVSLDKELGLFSALGKALEQVQVGFRKAVQEEAKSQSMKTELITNVSHDLKTPLTSIITYVDLLKQTNISEEERKQYVDTLDQKSQRLKVLIEDLFEVSKAQSGNVQMNFADIDIVSLMKQVYTEMDDQIEASNLTFRFHLPDKKIILSLDGQRTYRVFENLLNNTLKYSMAFSRVYVDVTEDEQCVKVIFRNTSAQEMAYTPEQLTERFVRGDTSRKTEGSGLGLAIAKSFVELQNGKMTIETDGDLFKVILIWNK